MFLILKIFSAFFINKKRCPTIPEFPAKTICN